MLASLSGTHGLLLLALGLFLLGLVGFFLHRTVLVRLLINVELILLASNSLWIAFSRMHHNLDGQIMVFFVLTVAAAEAAIGLTLLVLWYRLQGDTAVDNLRSLRG